MKLMTIKEVSELLKVKQSTLYSWVHYGTMPYYKLNGLLRFEENEILEWVKNSKVIRSDSDFPIRKPSKNLDIDSMVKRAIADVKKKKV